MKVHVPGLGKATGNVGIPLLPDGKYLFEAQELKSEEKSSGTSFQLKLTVLDTQNEGEAEDFVGRTYTEFFFVLPPDHEWQEIGLNQFKNALNAFGVKVDKDDNFDENRLPGKRAWGKVRTKQRKPYTDRNGKLVTPVPRNTVVEWYPEDADEEVPATPKRRTRR